MKAKAGNQSHTKSYGSKRDDVLEAGQLKPKNEGINNTDVPGVPPSKRAQNNPTGQDEGLSSGGSDPLADL